jgi:hypothetical protein
MGKELTKYFCCQLCRGKAVDSSVSLIVVKYVLCRAVCAIHLSFDGNVLQRKKDTPLNKAARKT